MLDERANAWSTRGRAAVGRIRNRNRVAVVLRAFERGLRWTVTFGAWLPLPLALLPFVQWPLREVVQAGVALRE